jgi:uncharacterized membrane protein
MRLAGKWGWKGLKHYGMSVIKIVIIIIIIIVVFVIIIIIIIIIIRQ